MPYFAELDADNACVRVTYSDDPAPTAYAWLLANLGGTWVRTYLGMPGKTYAGEGYIYDPVTEDFTAP